MTEQRKLGTAEELHGATAEAISAGCVEGSRCGIGPGLTSD